MDNPFDREKYPELAPECVIIGQFTGWKLDYDYGDAEYSMRYVLTPIGATDDSNDIAVAGTRVTLTDGSYWIFEIDTATSNGYSITDDTEYRWDLLLTQTSSSNSTAIRSGFMRFFTSTSDRRSHAEKVLAQINALLEGKAKDDVASYSIKSRSLTRLSFSELLEARDYYINEVRRTGGSVDTGKKRVKTNTVQARFV
jgi:hypothetical protein